MCLSIQSLSLGRIQREESVFCINAQWLTLLATSLMCVIDRVINKAGEGPSPLQGAGAGIMAVSIRDEPFSPTTNNKKINISLV